MILNSHLSLEGKHALLSPSKYHWLFDDDDSFRARLASSYASELGTALHDEARKRIQYRYKLFKNDKRSIFVNILDKGIPMKLIDYIDFDSMYENLATYVNDSISFNMSPEVIIFYSEYCFGTADALIYEEKTKTLRIHDLKTGNTIAKMEQLYIYAALFFLEYTYIKPGETDIQLRIYQSNEIREESPGVDIILPIMDRIKRYDKIAHNFKG